MLTLQVADLTVTYDPEYGHIADIEPHSLLDADHIDDRRAVVVGVGHCLNDWIEAGQLDVLGDGTCKVPASPDLQARMQAAGWEPSEMMRVSSFYAQVAMTCSGRFSFRWACRRTGALLQGCRHA